MSGTKNNKITFILCIQNFGNAAAKEKRQNNCCTLH